MRHLCAEPSILFGVFEKVDQLLDFAFRVILPRHVLEPGVGDFFNSLCAAPANEPARGARATEAARQAEYPLPPQSVALIDRYLTHFRPILTTGGSTALFPGRSGAPQHPNALREQICNAVFEHLGVRVNPHLFRHIAAKLFLDANPGSYEVMRRVLGHRSVETTTAFYTGLETPAAVRHFDATILKLRKGGSRS